MKRMSFPFVAGAMILSIAACSGNDPVDNNAAAVEPAATNMEAPIADPVAGGPPPAATVNADAPAGADGAIPAALHGRWGLTPADCTTTNGDDKGLLTISADRLKFYESRALPGTSIETGANSISGNWNFEGEGQTWSKYVSLKLERGSLIRTERDPVASYTYAKCD